MLWPSGAKKLIDRLPIDSPVDNFMSWASHTNFTKAYAIREPIIKQEAPWNWGSDVSHSDELSKRNRETEEFRQHLTLLSRPLREAQQKFSSMMRDALASVGDDSDEAVENSTLALAG